jgi:hypothetical protein
VIDELLEKYREAFDDAFPLMCCMDMTDEEIADRIRACLDAETPFEPVDGADY